MADEDNAQSNQVNKIESNSDKGNAQPNNISNISSQESSQSNESNLSRTERKKLRKQQFKEQQKTEQGEQKKKNLVKNIIIVGVIAAVIVGVVLLFMNLTAFKQPSVNANDPVFGPADSKVTVIMFGDMQCPYTKSFHNTKLKELMDKYDGKVRWVSKEMVTGKYPNSQQAAEATLCSGEQGKYWEFQKLVFERSATDSSSLRSYAKILELNIDKFDECVNSKRYKDKIRNDYKEGNKAQVTITPTFFVNGIKLQGDIQSQYFQQAIEGELNR